MVKVLFVCLGNICRSPLAQGVFEKKLKNRGLDHKIECDSAGTGDYHVGEDPDPRSVEVARLNGIQLNHSGRQMQEEDLEDFDYILAMDRKNKKSIERLIKASGITHNNIFMMRDFDTENKGADVPDPYFGGDNGFQDVYDMLDRAIDYLIDYIVEQEKIS